MAICGLKKLPSPGGNKILNGFIFSLAGIYDYYKVTHEIRAKKILEAGLISLNNHISDYDLEFTSRYSLLPNNIDWNYNKIHVNQLLWAGLIMNQKNRLHEYAAKFLNYDPISYNVKVNSFKNRNFGPDRLNDKFMFWKYWSAGKFPIKIRIDLNRPHEILGIVFYSPSINSMPNNYSINILNSDNKLLIEYDIKNESSNGMKIISKKFIRSDDETLIRIHSFDKKIEAEYIEITIDKVLNPKTIALREISFITDKKMQLDKYLEQIKKRI